MEIKGLQNLYAGTPRYLKALLISLMLTATAVLLLRWSGFPISPISDKTPKAFMLGFAFLLPSLSLSIDSKYLKGILTSIDESDRSPLLLLLLAQVFWFYSTWFSMIFISAYLAFVLGRFLRQWQKAKKKTQGLSQIKEAIQQRAKEMPLYLWCLIALFFLNAVGLIWQKQADFPNLTDRYIFYVLLPLSLFIYKPKRSSVYRFVRFALPIVLAMLSVYLLYVMLFHLVYFPDQWAWLKQPLSRIYQAKLFAGDTYIFYNDWLEAGHPSYMLLALLPYFLISFFSKAKTQYSQREESVFILLTSIFVLFTHLRYGLYFVGLMLILWIYRVNAGAFRLFFKKNVYWLLPALGLSLAFLYMQRTLFVDNLRLELYEEAVRQIKAFPVLGQGTGAEMVIFKNKGAINHSHAHNLLLSMMVNFGIIGLLWTGLFILSLLYRAVREHRILFFFVLFLLPMFIIESPFTYAYTSYFVLLSLFIFEQRLTRA